MADEATSAAVTLGVPPAASTSEQMTYNAAVARKQELFNTPKWAQRYLDGDATARREFAEITAALAKGEPDPGRTAREIAVSGNGYLTEYHRMEHIDRIPTTRAIHEEALQMRADLIKDPEFYRKWQAHDHEARRKLSRLAIVLNQPIKD
jgi:hypothetical protein